MIGDQEVDVWFNVKCPSDDSKYMFVQNHRCLYPLIFFLGLSN